MIEDDRVLLGYVVAETGFLGYIAVQLALGFGGAGGAWPGLGPLVRGALLLVVMLEMAVPVAVYVDVARRSDDPDPIWVHAAMMPVVNILGLVAYLEDRQHSR